MLLAMNACKAKDQQSPTNSTNTASVAVVPENVVERLLGIVPVPPQELC